MGSQGQRTASTYQYTIRRAQAIVSLRFLSVSQPSTIDFSTETVPEFLHNFLPDNGTAVVTLGFYEQDTDWLAVRRFTATSDEWLHNHFSAAGAHLVRPATASRPSRLVDRFKQGMKSMKECGRRLNGR